MDRRRELFVAAYLHDPNGTKAAIKAGYAKSGASTQAVRLLANAKIKAAIDRGMKRRLDKLEISAERVLNEIAKLAFANMTDYMQVTADGQFFVDFSTLTHEQAAAIQEIVVDETAGGTGDDRRERVQRTRFKLADKGLNLERLGRHLKLFTDKIEHSGDDALIARLDAGRKRIAESNA